MAIFDVHQVWPPVAAKQTDLTIILFHGLQMADQTDAWKYTWTTEKTQVFWPQEWLPEDLGKEKVRVLSVSYNSRASQWGKGDEEHEVKKFGSNLRHELIHEGGRWWLHKGNKIVLIGHSFGGIIIKSLIVEASEHEDCKNCKTFLEFTNGMIFYAVPHSGSLIAQYVVNYNKAFPHRLDGILKKQEEFETEMEELSKKFEASLQRPSKNNDPPHVIKIYSFAEQLPYNKVLVVPWTSVSKLRGPSMTLEANHMDICKPSMKGDRGYQKLLEILELCKAKKGVQLRT